MAVLTEAIKNKFKKWKKMYKSHELIIIWSIEIYGAMESMDKETRLYH